jgi:hypothetical protein
VTTGPPTHAREHTMTATTATAPRFVGVRAEGRYRVQDTLTGEYVAICASKAKAAYAAERLNAQEAAEATAAAPVDRAAQAIEDARAHLAAHPELVDEELAAELAEESPADARSARAAELAEAVAAGEVSFDAAAAELLGGAPVAPLAVVALDGEETTVETTATPAAKPAKPAKKDDSTRAYRVGKVLREWVLSRVTPADSALVEHITGRNVCYDGTATLRLTAEWAEELSGHATDLENAAMSADENPVPVALRAPSIMAARAAQKGLAKLF